MLHSISKVKLHPLYINNIVSHILLQEKYKKTQIKVCNCRSMNREIAEEN